MIKNKSIKKSSIYKGLSLAFAGVFAASLIPVNVIETKADYVGDIGHEAFYVENTVSEVNKGGTYEIRAAYFGSKSKLAVGLNNGAEYSVTGHGEISAVTSDVTVTYLATGEKVATTRNNDEAIKTALTTNSATAVWGTFEADYAGEYKVTYSMTIKENDGHEETIRSYETSTIVYSKVASAYFEFDSNDEKVIPSVYDVKMQSTLANVNLPLPTVKGSDDKAKTGVEFAANGDASALTASNYVDISVYSGEGKVAVDKNENGFYIDAKYLNPEDTANFKGEGNYIVKYSYYEGGQFIKSITKTFSVSKEYYKDYKLELSQNSKLTNAVTGVEVTLPTLTGKTSAKTTPANESVNIHYGIKAYRKVGGDYTEQKEGSIANGKFTPWADGNYKIVYEAEDFYGNKAESYFYIDNVKDTQRPVAKIYDASNKANYIDNDLSKGINEYIDASSALKTITGEKNIVIYAIGATDNVKDGLKYTRIIKKSAESIEIKDYADYNLIFNFDADSFLANNFYVNNLHATEDKSNLTQWLKDNKFLIVTNDSTKTVEEGYAYVDATSDSGLMIKGDDSGRTYTVVYYAEDAAGNTSTELTNTIKVMRGDYTDTAAPEITFVTNLKNSYRTNSVISFEKPTATDDDTRMDVVVEYKYDTESTWRTFEDEKYEIDLAEIEELLAASAIPTKVTIHAYAVDDYGMKGEWEKEIAIVDVVDNDVPVIVSEAYSLESPQNAVVEQNTEIVLPTIRVKDANVNYLNAEVFVDRIAEGKATSIAVYGKSEERNTSLGVYTLQAGKVVASYPGEYQVRVVFTDAGNNQITTFYHYTVEGKTIVEDPTIVGIGTTLGNNGVAEVGEAIDLGTPSIDFAINNSTHSAFGIKDDDSKAATNFNVKVVNGAPSTYKFNENEENTFTAYEEGNYKLQYFVKFSIFNKNKFEINASKTAVVVKDTENRVYPFANGDFMIINEQASSVVVKYAAKGTDKYTIFDLSSQFSLVNGKLENTGTSSNCYIDYYGNQPRLIFPNGQATAFGVVGNQFKVNTATVSASSETYDLDDYINYNLESTVLTVEVKDTKAPVMLGDYEYPATANVNDIISIQRVQAKDASASGINLKKSYVQVSVKGGNTSYSKQYHLDKWTQEDDYNETTKNIEYKVTVNGNCTITYYIYDYAGNLNSDCSYTIAVGDCASPKVTIAENFVKESYSLGELSDSNPLVLDFSKLSFDDNKTAVDDLKETVKVVVKNTSTGTEIANTGDAEANIYRYVPTEVGTYEISVSVTDDAGWTTTKTATFEIKAEEKEGTEVYEVVGTVLIVVAVAILAGVITYFVVSAVKRNKKNGKGKAKKADKADK